MAHSLCDYPFHILDFLLVSKDVLLVSFDHFSAILILYHSTLPFSGKALQIDVDRMLAGYQRIRRIHVQHALPIRQKINSTFGLRDTSIRAAARIRTENLVVMWGRQQIRSSLLLIHVQLALPIGPKRRNLTFR